MVNFVINKIIKNLKETLMEQLIKKLANWTSADRSRQIHISYHVSGYRISLYLGHEIVSFGTGSFEEALKTALNNFNSNQKKHIKNKLAELKRQRQNKHAELNHIHSQIRMLSQELKES